MDIGSILILFALLLLIGLFIIRPVLDGKNSTPVSQEEHELSALLAERDRTINALQELEFDQLLGKIPEEDYPVQRARMLQYGAEVLRKLDEYQGSTASAGEQQSPAEDRLEQVIASRRAASGSPDTVVKTLLPKTGNGNGEPDDALEALIAQRRRSRQGKAAGFCHQCGSPLQKSDQFCPRCGGQIG
jgi:hypothetical protein